MQGSSLSCDLSVFLLSKTWYYITMPSKNTIKLYDVPAYYHVYNRGAGRQAIFPDDADKEMFLSLLARHLDSADTTTRSDKIPYEKYAVELLAYCLMDNHFHLLLYQERDIAAVTKLLRSISTSYTMYFNKRYSRSGHLFQSVFKASRIDNEPYLAHISRYIHLNPEKFESYKWSSLGAYLDTTTLPWLHPERILAQSPERYEAFLHDYRSRRDIMKNFEVELGF